MTNKAKPDFRVKATEKNGDKTFYREIGVAWKRPNGVMSLKLYSIPFNGSMIVVPAIETEEVSADA